MSEHDYLEILLLWHDDIWEHMFLFLDLAIINFSMVLIDINIIIKYYTTVQKFVSARF